ncbi:MAG TPA: cupin, partial [Accumulibacter sp.]|nr:cupin [Accumulibacter sp.]
MNAEEAPADRPGNVFADLPKCSVGTQPDEQFVQLLQRPGLRIERIVSTGQASPAGFWYDQDEDEWILLLAGEAGLR